MGNITTTTGDKFIPDVWVGDILRHVRANLVAANLVKRYDSDVKSFGDVVHIPNLAAVTARSKSAGTAVTFDAATESENTLTVNKHKYFAFLLEDIVKAQSRYDLRDEYTSAAGYGLSVAIDTDLLANYATYTQATTQVAALDDPTIISAIEFLDIADAPRDNRSFIVHPEQMGDLRNLDKFTRYDATGAAGIAAGAKNGLIANAYGVEIYMSTNVPKASLVRKNFLFHKEAAALAMQLAPTVEAEYSVDYLGWKVAAQVLYGVAVLRNTFGVVVPCTTT